MKATQAPLCAKARPRARPSPRDPPVTRQRLSASAIAPRRDSSVKDRWASPATKTRAATPLVPRPRAVHEAVLLLAVEDVVVADRDGGTIQVAVAVATLHGPL